MIYSSTMDYGTKTALLLWENSVSDEELIEYCRNNFGSYTWEILNVDSPSEFKGLHNPGTATLKCK